MHYVLNVRAMGAAATLALGMAISIITSTVVASRAYSSRAAQTARAQQEITVKGSARTRVVSDLAVWPIEIINFNAELKVAYAGLEFGVDRAHAFLIEQGFSDNEITVGPIDTTTHQARDKDARETPQISGYTLRRSLTVTSADVQRTARAAGDVTRLLNEDVRVRSDPPQFTYSKVADLKVEILGLASKDARSRADQIELRLQSGGGPPGGDGRHSDHQAALDGGERLRHIRHIHHREGCQCCRHRHLWSGADLTAGGSGNPRAAEVSWMA